MDGNRFGIQEKAAELGIEIGGSLRTRWISVNERQPTKEEWGHGVLTYSKGGIYRVSGYSPRANGFWFQVTHWQPLYPPNSAASPEHPPAPSEVEA